MEGIPVVLPNLNPILALRDADYEPLTFELKLKDSSEFNEIAKSENNKIYSEEINNLINYSDHDYLKISKISNQYCLFLNTKGYLISLGDTFDVVRKDNNNEIKIGFAKVLKVGNHKIACSIENCKDSIEITDMIKIRTSNNETNTIKLNKLAKYFFFKKTTLIANLFNSKHI